MKKIILLFCFFGMVFINVNAQENELFPSISFVQSLNYGYPKKWFTVNNTEAYPDDLKTAKLFYVDIIKEDVRGNYDVIFGPNYKKINKNLRSNMEDHYPYHFEAFTNEFISKGKNYFLDKGFKYRLLINSTFYENRIVHNDKPDTIMWKQNFSIAVQNIETGEVYGDKWHWFLSYMNQFFKKIE